MASVMHATQRMRVKVAIAGPSGDFKRTPEFDKPEITIGRRPSNDVVLPDAGASGAHAKLLVTGEALTILDLDSTNGTYVNEQLIQGPYILQPGDLVEIGEFRLRFSLGDDAPAPLHPSSGDTFRSPDEEQWPAPPPMMDLGATTPDVDDGHSTTPDREPDRRSKSAVFPRFNPSPPPSTPPAEPSKPSSPTPVGFEFQLAPTALLKDRVFAAVLERIAAAIHRADAGVRQMATQLLSNALSTAAKLDPAVNANDLVPQMLEELVADGPWPGLLEGDPDHLVLRSTEGVRVDRGGHVTQGPSPFSCPTAVRWWVTRTCRLPFDRNNRTVQGRFGTYRLHALFESNGPVVSLRRLAPTTTEGPSLEAQVRNGILSPNIGTLLSACVVSRLNILVCAGPGSSTMPIIGALLACAPTTELQVVLANEGTDARSFPAHAVIIERANAHPSALDAALALGPNRVAITDLQWDEAGTITGIVSRSTSHMLSVRSTTTGMGLAQLETMLTRSMHAVAARQLLIRAVDLVVAVQLFADGISRVTQVSEPAYDESGRLLTRDVFALVPGSRTWQFSGFKPRCFEDMTRRGFPLDPSIFS